VSDTANRAALPPVHDGAAIAAIICAFVFAPLGIMLGIAHIGAARRAGRARSGLATAAVIVGSTITALAVAVMLMAIAPWPLALLGLAAAAAGVIRYLARAR
jgi:peptidyl-prolyl cis-trans isomerase B (cyclophilin B)